MAVVTGLPCDVHTASYTVTSSSRVLRSNLADCSPSQRSSDGFLRERFRDNLSPSQKHSMKLNLYDNFLTFFPVVYLPNLPAETAQQQCAVSPTSNASACHQCGLFLNPWPSVLSSNLFCFSSLHYSHSSCLEW